MISIDELRSDAAAMTGWERHRFFILIIGVILVSMLLVGVALNLYNSSGAAQVDLSRPGYQSIQKEASRSSIDDAFSSTGKLDAQAFESFDAMYDNHARRVVDTGSFDPNALDPRTLQVIVDPVQSPQTSE